MTKLRYVSQTTFLFTKYIHQCALLSIFFVFVPFSPTQKWFLVFSDQKLTQSLEKPSRWLTPFHSITLQKLQLAKVFFYILYWNLQNLSSAFRKSWIRCFFPRKKNDTFYSRGREIESGAKLVSQSSSIWSLPNHSTDSIPLDVMCIKCTTKMKLHFNDKDYENL